MRTTPGAVLVCLMLLTSGCSYDDPGESQARTVDPTTTSSTESSPSTTDAPSSGAMADVVVQLGDLPAGWTVSPPQEDEDEEFCEGHDPFNDTEALEEAETGFQQSDFGPFVFAAASRYSTGGGEAVLDALAEMGQACQSFTQAEDDGTETSYRITPLSFPALGDDTVAFRMSGTNESFGSLALDVVAVRIGDVVIALINGGLGSADTALTETLTRTMAERV